jgi:hypothetical protein
VMSKSNASAKSRRAFVNAQPSPSPIGQPTQSATPASGLTLQQVIAVIDKRLITLESFMKDSNDDVNRKVSFQDEASMPDVPSNLAEIISEFNSRFDLLAEEIGNIKDVVIKLQSYTMEVNKTLMDERIHILSDLGTITTETNNFTIDNMSSEMVDTNEADVPETMVPPQDTVETSLSNLGGSNYRRQKGAGKS